MRKMSSSPWYPGSDARSLPSAYSYLTEEKKKCLSVCLVRLGSGCLAGVRLFAFLLFFLK